MPACFIFTPAAIPPNPAPTTTTLGVPAGPNSSSAVGLTGAQEGSWRAFGVAGAACTGSADAGTSSRDLRMRAGAHLGRVELRFVDPDGRAVDEHVPDAGGL